MLRKIQVYLAYLTVQHVMYKGQFFISIEISSNEIK